MQLKERSYRFSLDVIKLIDKIDQKNMVTQVMSRQLIRSATSIGANIIEAQAGSSRKDFTNFFSHSLKSTNETIYWLKLLADSKKADNTKELLDECREIAKILASSIITLKNKNK